MANPDVTETEGTIIENLPNAMFRVKLVDASQVVLCHLAGKMRRLRFMRLLPGDRVRLEVPTADPSKGRITYRLK